MDKSSKNKVNRTSQVLVPAKRQELSSDHFFRLLEAEGEEMEVSSCSMQRQKGLLELPFGTVASICTLTTETSGKWYILYVLYIMYFLRACLFFPLVLYFALADSIKCFYHTHRDKKSAWKYLTHSPVCALVDWGQKDISIPYIFLKKYFFMSFAAKADRKSKHTQWGKC